MGGTNWSDQAYSHRTTTRAANNQPAFQHDADVKAGKAAALHESLDPKKMKNGVREVRDSEAHPESHPVYIGLDVTGSMLRSPHVMQAKLPTLMGLLTRKGYLAHPAICVSAIGDMLDQVPFQVGQFESGLEIDNDLTNIYLEGNGHGNDHENYELGLFFLARCVKSDAWEKRQHKGYAFILCDEGLRPTVRASDIRNVFGLEIESDIPTDKLVAEVLEKWELFCVVPADTSHASNEHIRSYWKQLLGERVLSLSSSEGVSEFIAGIIGRMEQDVSMDQMVADMTDEGTTDSLARSLSTTLSKVGTASGRSVSKLTSGSTGLVAP